MMIHPALEVLLTKVENKFELVTLVAKRARQLNNGAPKLVHTDSTKPVTIALEEIAADAIKARQPTPPPRGGQ